MLEKILKLPNGAKYYKCDLHNHTPFDKGFSTGGFTINSENDRLEFARKYLRWAKQQGIEILGITEHNDASWIPIFQQVEEEFDLTIFPGVELGVMDGKNAIHYIALFEPGTDGEEINHLISDLGLKPKARFHDDKSVKSLPKEKHGNMLTKKVQEESGIAFAAHMLSDSGLLKDQDGESRITTYKDSNLLAGEISGSLDDLAPDSFSRRCLSGQLDLYGDKKLALLNNSDGRAIEIKDGKSAMGSKYTYIKLSKPTIEGLRQAFIDHDSRVRLKDQLEDEDFPQIIGISIDNSFLQGENNDPFMLHFNPNLNCLIGGRGSGKSALVEIIRFAFNLDAKTEDSKKQATELIDYVLNSGAKITI